MIHDGTEAARRTKHRPANRAENSTRLRRDDFKLDKRATRTSLAKPTADGHHPIND
jgi:hypothetical protein